MSKISPNSPTIQYVLWSCFHLPAHIMYMCSSYVPVLPLPRSVSRWDSDCGRGGTGLQVHHRHAVICQPPRQEGLLWKGRQHSVFRDGCMVCCTSYRFLVMWGLQPREPKILGMGNQYNFMECTFLWCHIACFVGSTENPAMLVFNIKPIPKC